MADWLAENYDEMASRFGKAEDALVANAAKVVAGLDNLTAELDELSATADFVTGRCKRPPMARHGGGSDPVALLIAAVRTGRHLFREPYVG